MLVWPNLTFLHPNRLSVVDENVEERVKRRSVHEEGLNVCVVWMGVVEEEGATYREGGGKQEKGAEQSRQAAEERTGHGGRGFQSGQRGNFGARKRSGNA